MTFLFTKTGEPPWDYVALRLCRDIYHCTPSQLGEQDWEVVEHHLYLLGIEAEVQEFERNNRG